MGTFPSDGEFERVTDAAGGKAGRLEADIASPLSSRRLVPCFILFPLSATHFFFGDARSICILLLDGASRGAKKARA